MRDTTLEGKQLRRAAYGGLASRKAWFAKQSGSRLPIGEWLGSDPKHFDFDPGLRRPLGIGDLASRILRLLRESEGRDFIQNEHIELPLKTFGGAFGTAASAASGYRRFASGL